MKPLVFTALFPFCGLGAGARGFLDARVSLLGHEARFEALGGIDFDADACADFTMLTGAPAWCTDIAAITPAELRARYGDRAPDVVFMSPPCLPGGGIVLTAKGPARIDSVRAGSLVLTHVGRYRPVLCVGSHVYDGTVHAVRVAGSVDVQEFTAEHPIWSRRIWKPVVAGAQRKRMGSPVFRPAAELRAGDYVGFPSTHECYGVARTWIASFGDPQIVRKGGQRKGRYAKPLHAARSGRVIDLRPFCDHTALWFLLGVYLGDGYRRPSRHEVIFCVGAGDGDLARRVRLALDDLGIGWNYDAAGGPTNYKIRAHARHLSVLTGAFGDGAQRKCIPEALQSLETPLLRVLLDGYLAADGCDTVGRRGKRRLKAASISLQLLRDVQRASLRFGEFWGLSVSWPGGVDQTIEGRVVKTRARWELSFQPDKVKRTSAFFEDGVAWIRVRSIATRVTKERVWNLEVEEDDTFCAPLMATHNCKGASGLLSEEKSRTPKYAAMNRLALVWTETMLAAWPEPPKLVLLENVPRLKKRAAGMVRELRAVLRRAGYVFSDGFHDCGELGALAQHRRRYLLVARHAKSVAPLLYQPPKRRVRACGEVLGELPMPEDLRGGRMHKLPKISWLNWVRLALIPAGGDWRDLDGVLADGEPRRAKFKRHRVERWDEPTGTIGGSGSNGVENVADPRIALSACKPNAHHNKYRVEDWREPAHTVIGATRPGSGAPAVADPRVDRAFAGGYGVTPWSEPARTITGESNPSNGSGSVADPRVERAFDHGYAVLDWREPSATIAGKSHPGNGAYSVADVRVEDAYRGSYGVLSWEEAAATVTGRAGVATGPFSVADPRKPPPITPMIVAADGTWHRPLTTLELAALQGLPTILNGAPLQLAGDSASKHRERIGNAVPCPAATAIAVRMLVALVEAHLGAFSLSSGAVWVRPEVCAS